MLGYYDLFRIIRSVGLRKETEITIVVLRA